MDLVPFPQLSLSLLAQVSVKRIQNYGCVPGTSKKALLRSAEKGLSEMAKQYVKPSLVGSRPLPAILGSLHVPFLIGNV